MPKFKFFFDQNPDFVLGKGGLENTWQSLNMKDLSQQYQNLDDTFTNEEATLAGYVSENRFHLVSLAASNIPDEWFINAGTQYFLPGQTTYEACAEALQKHSTAPEYMQTCLNNLPQLAQWQNYYVQFSMQRAFEENNTFPSAFYVDVVTPDGNIQTGSTDHYPHSDVEEKIGERTSKPEIRCRF